MSQSLDLIIAAKNSSDAQFAKLQAGLVGVETQLKKLPPATEAWSSAQQRAAQRMENMHEAALKMNTGLGTTDDKAQRLSSTINTMSSTLTSSAAAMGMPIGQLGALNSAADIAGMGMGKLTTTMVGFNTASFAVAGAGLAVGAAIGTWLRTFPAVAKAADDAAAALYRLFQSQKDIDAQAMAGKGLGEFQQRMAADNAKAMERQIQTLRNAGMSAAQIQQVLFGKQQTLREKTEAGLEKETAAYKKAQTEREKLAEKETERLEKVAESVSKATVTWTGFFYQMPAAIAPAKAAMFDFTNTMDTQIQIGSDRLRELGMVIDESTGLWTRYADVVDQELENADAGIQEHGAEFDGITGRILNWVETNIAAIASISANFRELGDTFGGTAGQIFSALADIGEGLVAGVAAAQDWADAHGAMAKAAVVANVAMVAYKGGALKGAIAGATFGASFGPIGAAVGGVVGGILGFIGAAKRAREEAKRLALQIDTARKAFIEGQGGLKVLELAAERAGVSLQGMFNAKTVAEYEAAVKRVEEAIALTQEATDLTIEAMDRWGVEMSQMGPEFQQQQLHESLIEIYRDFMLLTAAGADAAMMLSGPMGDAIETLVQQSIAAGVALPETMRPMIQQMIDLGLLFDENGEKITDISQMQFTETLEAGVTRLILKIEQLVNALLGIPNIDRTVTVTTRTGGGAGGANLNDDGSIDHDYDPSTPMAEGGWFPYRPGGYPVTVGEEGDEAIVPKEKMAGIIAQAMAMSGGGGGGGGVVHNHFHLDGRELREWYIRQERVGALTRT